MPSRSAGLSFLMFEAGRDMAKPCSRQNSRRTAASVSEKVGRRLRYQALFATARYHVAAATGENGLVPGG